MIQHVPRWLSVDVVAQMGAAHGETAAGMSWDAWGERAVDRDMPQVGRHREWPTGLTKLAGQILPASGRQISSLVMSDGQK